MTDAEFYILIALLPHPKHGYQIMVDITEDPMLQYKLGPATLYTTLKRLLKEGLIEEQKQSSNDPRRKFYRITPNGQKAAQEHCQVLRHALTLAEQRLNPT